MATFGIVETFDMKPENWSAYEDRIELFLDANSVEDDKKVSTFLSLVGPQCYNLVKTLCSPEKPSDKPVTELFMIIREHFCPKKIIIAERYRFHNAEQTEGETIAEYVTKLKKLSENCRFGEILSDMLKDRFVCGLKDQTTLERLLTEEDLTFQSAISISTTMETVAKDSEELYDTSNEPSSGSESDSDGPTQQHQIQKGDGQYPLSHIPNEGGPLQQGQFSRGNGPPQHVQNTNSDGLYPLGQISNTSDPYPLGKIPYDGGPYPLGQIVNRDSTYPHGQFPNDGDPVQQGQFPGGAGPLHQSQFSKGDYRPQQSPLTLGAAAQLVDGIVNKILTHRSEEVARPASQGERYTASAPHQGQFPMEEVHHTHVSAPRPVVHYVRVNSPRPVVHHIKVHSPRPVVHHVKVNAPRLVVHHVKGSGPSHQGQPPKGGGPPQHHHGSTQKPTAHPGQQKPKAHPGQQTPKAHQGQQKPKAHSGQQTPQAQPGQQKPKAHPGQQTPKAHPGQQNPKAHSGQQTSKPHPGQQKPKGNPGQQKPKGNPGQQKSKGNPAQQKATHKKK